MILVAVLAVAFALVLASGGNLRNLAAVRIRHSEIAAVALGVQILVINVVPGELPRPLAAAAHVATYLLLATFLYCNRHLPWIWAVALGGGMNFAAIAANGGVMPASPAAMRTAGLSPAADHFTNSGAVGDVRLAWLGDIFAVPERFPLANVFSAGDVVLVVGAALLLRGVLHARPEDRALAVPDAGRRGRRDDQRARW